MRGESASELSAGQGGHCREFSHAPTPARVAADLLADVRERLVHRWPAPAGGVFEHQQNHLLQAQPALPTPKLVTPPIARIAATGQCAQQHEIAYRAAITQWSQRLGSVAAVVQREMQAEHQ